MRRENDARLISVASLFAISNSIADLYVAVS